MMYRYGIVIVVVLGALFGAYRFGASVATTKAEREAAQAQVVASVAAAKQVSELADKLRIVESDLLAEQSREIEERIVESIKYRTIYRDKIIKVPHIVECVNDSGLLDLINSTMPTVET